MTAYDATTARDTITFAKDNELEVIVALTDGTSVSGDPISVNSKGVNIKVDGKVRSIALSRITGVAHAEDEDAMDDDELTDEEIYAELGEGMTTAELAAHLSDALNLTDFTPKALRVHLRALGLGVGKGRKYSLSATEFRMVRDLVKADAS